MKPDTDYNAWLTGFSHLIYQEKAMSQVTLARRVNVDKSYVNTILKGTKTAGYHLQHAIASALGYSHGQVVELGKLLLSGVPGEEALEQARRTVFGVGNVTLPGFKIRGEATNTPPASGGVVRIVDGERSAYKFLRKRQAPLELSGHTVSVVHNGDGTYTLEQDPFDTLTGPAMNSLRDWWRKKHGDTHNSAAQFVMELGRRFPEMSPVVQITGDKPPGGGQGK